MSFKTYEVRVFDDGSKSWWLNGQLHREDGPACEWVNGSKSWWLNGQPMTEAEHAAKTAKTASSCHGKVVEIDGKKYKLTEV